MTINQPLEGTALVTGAGRGIGANIARRLGAAGMRVWVADQDTALADAVGEEVGGSPLHGDVSVQADVDRWSRSIGHVDLLVCNAGIQGPPEPLADVEDWWRTFEVNVLGAYRCIHSFVPTMLEDGGGRVVNITSTGAYIAWNGHRRQNTAYPASKAALHRLSEVLAAHLTGRGVFVFSVSPGLVLTEMTSGYPDNLDLPWTPPEAAPRLVHALATGEFDRLAGRYLHAEDDAPEKLRSRLATIEAADLNAIRLRRGD